MEDEVTLINLEVDYKAMRERFTEDARMYSRKVCRMSESQIETVETVHSLIASLNVVVQAVNNAESFEEFRNLMTEITIQVADHHDKLNDY